MLVAVTFLFLLTELPQVSDEVDALLLQTRAPFNA
jgi:hypothetical protein